MTDEPQDEEGAPPAIVLYAIYATSVAILIAVLIRVGGYVSTSHFLDWPRYTTPWAR